MAKTATAASKREIKRCHAGHEIARVKVVRVKGRIRFEWRCLSESGSVVECR